MTWEAVIGLEVHVQLATASKAFSPSAQRYGAEPNSLTDPVVLGLPGALPVYNASAVELALRLGLACGCTIAPVSRFARKHYFYPDLPKGYQISQYDEPLCAGGAIRLLGRDQSVRLIRIHLEEDAGKLVHGGAGASRVDLDRAGVPLVEVVSEPDLRSAEDAAEYMRALAILVRALGVSEADMEKGQLRCDANVSLRRPGAERYGTRTELKNINSFRFVHRAIEHEIARQAAILDGGGTIVQETRLWDADAGQSHSMRGKEEALDYRYFPDPDLPPLVIDEATIARVRGELPRLPADRLDGLVRDHGVGLDEARTIASEAALADYVDRAIAAGGAGRAVAGFVLTELLGALNRDGRAIEASPVSAEHVAALLALVDDGTISTAIAKRVFATMYASGEAPGVIVEREGLRQVRDTGAIEALARQIIEANPRQAEQYRAGKDSLLGFFVGQLMKASGGKANPQLASEVIRRLLAG